MAKNNKFPDGWRVKSLRQAITALESGSRPRGGVSDIQEGIPSIGGEHLNKLGGFNFERLKLIPHEFYEKQKRGKIRDKDILIVKDGATTGKTAFVGEDFPFKEASVNEHVFIVRANKDIVLPEYLYYYAFSFYGQNQILKNFRGSAQGGINSRFADYFKVPIPPIKTQKNIISILKKVEETNKLRIEADKLLDDFLKSKFLEMFDGKKINVNQYDIRELKEFITEFRYGTSVKSGNDGYPILGIPNVLGDKLIIKNLKSVKITEKEFEKYRLKKFDILFVRTNGNPNYIGRCGIIDLDEVENYVFASYLIRARLKRELLNPYFLKTYLELPLGRKELRSKCRTTAGQYNINTHGLGSIKIPLPDIGLQNRFEDLVKSVEEIKFTQGESKIEIQNLFDALMQKAFTGKLVA